MRLVKCLLILLCVFFLTKSHAQENFKWQPMPFSLNQTPQHLFTDTADNAMYIAGEFETVDHISCNVVYYKNGRYKLLPKVPSYPVGQMIMYKGELYAGGLGLYKLDKVNDQWINIDSSTPSARPPVTCLYIYQNQLLVAGIFKKIGGKNISTIARYDGTDWSDFKRADTFLPAYANIATMAEYNGSLYVAGNFSDANRPDIGEIAMFDGQHWQSVGKGIRGDALSNIWRMKVWRDELYVAGEFNTASGSPGTGIAKWNGTAWDSLSDGFVNSGYPGTVTDLINYHNRLWVTGYFTDIGGVKMRFVSRWDGERWCAAGDFDGPAIALGVYNDTLFLGGGFRSVDGDSTIQFMGKWVGGDHSDACTRSYNDTSLSNGIILFPNPSKDRFYLHLNGITAVEIHAADGRKLITVNQNITDGIDVHMLPAGIYFVTVYTGNNTHTVRLCKL